MSTLFKSPVGRNKFSGNVSISYSEFESIRSGEYTHIHVEGKNFDFTITVVDWMIVNAQDNDGYMLFPYSEKSFLVKGR